MKRFINIQKAIAIVLLLVQMSSCNKWLDINPVGVQTSDSYWQTKEEVEQVLTGAYIQLRSCMPYFFKWGELRGDELEFGGNHSTASDDVTIGERNIRQLNILPSNPLNQWSEVYSAIGKANTIIKFAPLALKSDITFTQELCNSFIAEAVFIRSLCYFYLVRVFKDVPYIVEPYADDSNGFTADVTEGNVILDRLINDCKEYVVRCKPGYEIEWQTKGRATSWAFYALLADMYLWKGEYQEVRNIYNIFVAAGFELEETKDYFSVFYPGNSKKESIFELQFRSNFEGQSNSLYSWFTGSAYDARYIISRSSRDLFENDPAEDVRGNGYMYDTRYLGEKYWKYLGIVEVKKVSNSTYLNNYMRPASDNKYPNYIFYRFADIVLMEAEAMCMLGESNASVCEFLDNTIRKRAGYTTAEALVPPLDENAMLTIILEERQKEFLGEGKQWFDVLRVARHDNYKYINKLITMLVNKVPAKDRAMWKIKLQNEYSHYLPIYKKEIDNSHGALTQNPFYKNVE